MRMLVYNRIIANWIKGVDDMLNVCYVMRWESESVPDGIEILIQHLDEDEAHLVTSRYRLEYGKDSPNLRLILAACSDEAMLTWLEAQHSQIYR
jgi:hypothetical protein